MKDDHINVFYSDEDGGYIGDIPDLEACSAFGKSPEEARASVKSPKTLGCKPPRRRRSQSRFPGFDQSHIKRPGNDR